jgi:hypothetical protein
MKHSWRDDILLLKVGAARAHFFLLHFLFELAVSLQATQVHILQKSNFNLANSQ